MLQQFSHLPGKAFDMFSNSEKERSFTFFPIGIVRKHKHSRSVFLCRQINIELVAVWRHFHSNHNCKFSVAFIANAVHTAVVRGFTLALFTSYIEPLYSISSLSAIARFNVLSVNSSEKTFKNFLRTLSIVFI